MNLEQLALMGILVFGIGAVLYAFRTIGSINRLRRRPGEHRPRRPINSPASARAMAEGLIREVGTRHEELVARAREQGTIGPELLEALEEPRQYFRERVDVRCRPIFNQVVDEKILGRAPEQEPGDPLAT